MTGETYRTRQATSPLFLESDKELGGRKGLPGPTHQQRAPRLCGLCCAVVLSVISAPALADSSVFVNEALLDGISQQGVPVLPYNAQATYGGQPGFSSGGAATTIVGTNPDGSQYYVTRPSTLLFPPPRFPRSRVTIIDSGTASGSGTAYSFNNPASGNGTATQSAARLTPPSPDTATTAQKAESRLLVPLPPSIAQQPAAPKAAKQVAAKPKAAPNPPKQIAKAKAPEPPKVPAPPKTAAAASNSVAAAPTPKAPAPKVPAPKAPTQKAAAPKAIAAPPPPKIVPKQLAETAAPKTASLAAPPAPKAPSQPRLTETTSSLTPPPPPPPVTPSGAATAAKPQQQAAAPKAAQDATDSTPSQQSASRGNPAAQVSEVQVLFGTNEAALSGAAKSALENVAQSMLENDSSEIQLFAYAGQTGTDATQARRLSLSRAMAVRAFLIGKGIRPARMQVRALGNKTTSGSPDRVDVVPAKR